jgi:hypothetical protein
MSSPLDHDSSSPTPTNWPQWSIAAIFVITLVGLGLRLLNLNESLWLDELHTGWVVKDAWSDVAGRAQIGNQSPTWFYAVKLVTSVLGESEWTLRLLSLLAGTALIPTAFWLVRSLATVGQHGNKPAASIAGLLAAALVAVDHNCIFYATEARPYACLQLCAAWQLGLLWRNLRNPTTASRLGWIGLTALLFYLHYTGILVVLGELVALAAYYLASKDRVPYRPWRALFDGQVAVMLCLPALPHLWEVSQRRAMWSTMIERPDVWGLWYLFPFPTLLIATVVAAFSLLFHRTKKLTIGKSYYSFFLVAIWFVIPILAAWLAARFDVARLFLPRYLIAFAIGPMLLTGLCLATLPRRSWQVALALLLFGYAVYDSQIIEQIRYDGRAVGDRDEDWRGAIAELNKQWSAQPRLVIVDAGLVDEDYWFLQEDIAGFRLLQNRSMTDVRNEYFTFPLRSLYQSAFSDERIITAEKLLDLACEPPKPGRRAEPVTVVPLKRNAPNVLLVRRGEGHSAASSRSVFVLEYGYFLLERYESKSETHFGDVHVLELTLQQQEAE